MGIPDSTVKSSLAWFAGVKRRFTYTGTWRGITVIDDYGHHPTEIAAVLKAARTATDGKIVAIVQPHRYSRLRDLFNEFCNCFNDADTVIVSDVYAAGEDPIEGIDRDSLIHGLRQHGHRHVVALDEPKHLAELVKATARTGDYVVCLGAGTITNWANALSQELEALSKKEGKVS
jgi:UDP-N-acetylmuramate--alanine ligase